MNTTALTIHGLAGWLVLALWLGLAVGAAVIAYKDGYRDGRSDERWKTTKRLLDVDDADD